MKSLQPIINPAHDLKARSLLVAMLRSLAPPKLMRLSEWAEANIILPAAQNPMGGRFRNWPYMVDIMDDIGDASVEQVTLQKAARIGFTKGLIVALAAKVANDPCPIGMLVPRDGDVRDVAVDEVEPLFNASPALTRLMPETRSDGRTTLSRKQFIGGASLKILAAKSPANLRRHGFKVLYADEIDAMEVTSEGDPLKLAVNRTLAYPDRKLVWGSTPTEEEISNVERKYLESDKRIYEVQCPQCAERFELLWPCDEYRRTPPPPEHGKKGYINWPSDDPDGVHAVCPNGCVIEERHKRTMVEGGRWRATAPEVDAHHGYKLNALVSLLPQTGWAALVKDYLEAKRGGPSMMQVFVNQTLAETWSVALNKLDAEQLLERGEPAGLERIPDWCVLLTAGVDVQDDRLEISIVGWPLPQSQGRALFVGAPIVLSHHVIDGNTLDDTTWNALDQYLRRTYQHPNGWRIGIDATAIDSGGSRGRTQKVYDFCGPRSRRRIFAIKGAGGPRQLWKRAEKTKKNAHVYIVGHDQAKTEVLDRLALAKDNPHAIRVSDELDESWAEGVTSEVRRIRYVHNRPIIEFVLKRMDARNEPLDCLCYAWAIRFSASVKSIDLAERAARTLDDRGVPRAKKVASWAQAFNSP